MWCRWEIGVSQAAEGGFVNSHSSTIFRNRIMVIAVCWSISKSRAHETPALLQTLVSPAHLTLRSDQRYYGIV